MQKWMSYGEVDFAELFRGFCELTIRVREAGCTAAEGFDKYAITYERCWCLDRRADQADCAWLLVYGLRPRVIHLGPPSTSVQEAAAAQRDFMWAVAEHQCALKHAVSIETPKATLRA